MFWTLIIGGMSLAFLSGYFLCCLLTMARLDDMRMELVAIYSTTHPAHESGSNPEKEPMNKTRWHGKLLGELTAWEASSMIQASANSFNRVEVVE